MIVTFSTKKKKKQSSESESTFGYSWNVRLYHAMNMYTKPKEISIFLQTLIRLYIYMHAAQLYVSLMDKIRRKYLVFSAKPSNSALYFSTRHKRLLNS